MKKSISGIRGCYGSDLTLEHMRQYCANFSSLIPLGKCAVGIDTRPSGPDIKNTICSTLNNLGVDVYDFGMVPTPVVFRESRNYGAGIMITSSHNPVDWNGLKFILNGRGINLKELQLLLNGKIPNPLPGGNTSYVQSNYIEDAIAIIGNVNKPQKVSVDIGGGAARFVAPRLLEKLKCDVSLINETLENSNRGPDPTSVKLTDLEMMTKSSDIGFAFDLDADRLVVAKNGKTLSSDVTLGLGISRLLDLDYKKFVLSIDTSISIEKFIKSHNGIVQRSPVGEANVVEQILESKSDAGGEGSSAGFILPNFNYCRDGILTCGLIISMMDDKSFTDILSFMQNYQQIRTKVNIDSQFHKEILKLLHTRLSKDSSELVVIDGIKAIFDEDSWALIRSSNTEDVIRISVESNNVEKVSTLAKKIQNMVMECFEQTK